MSETLLQEYIMLKNEIINKIERHNNLSALAITTTVAILTFALSCDTGSLSSFIFLLPYAALIPISLRIAYQRRAIARISAYIIVFLESDSELDWETRNNNITKWINNRGMAFFVSHIGNYECAIMGILCSVLFWHRYLQYECSYSIVGWLLSIFLFLIEAIITVYLFKVDDERDSFWIKLWTEEKHRERNNGNSKSIIE